jgi:phosphate transport system substrate-binding protein
LLNRFNKKWLIVLTSLLLVTAIGFTACSSAATTTTSTQPTSTTQSISKTTTTSAPVQTTSTTTTFAPITSTTTQPTSTTSTTTTVITSTTAPATTSTSSLPIVALNGAGGTFPAPLYTSWFATYAKLTGVQVNYQAVGSGAGITAITNNTVDFGASDAIMTSAQVTAAQASNGTLLTIPTTMGAVAIIYNISGLGNYQLKLSGNVLAGIYLKTISTWDDPAIVALNPGANLPHSAIAVVHRSDSSGTSYIFTNYLAQVSKQWSTQVGVATAVNWPGDVGGSGSAGVSAYVQDLTGSIGYVELAYAVQNNIAVAQMQNSSGAFITPSVASASAAADGVTLPANMLVMITNSSNPTAYPITGFTWLLVYQNQKDQVKGQELVNLLWWILTSAQQYNNALTYPSLPASAVTIAEAEVNSMTYNGQPLHHN